MKKNRMHIKLMQHFIKSITNSTKWPTSDFHNTETEVPNYELILLKLFNCWNYPFKFIPEIMSGHNVRWFLPIDKRSKTTTKYKFQKLFKLHLVYLTNNLYDTSTVYIETYNLHCPWIHIHTISCSFMVLKWT